MSQTGINRERLLASFVELLHINATSRREGPIARHIEAILTELGASVRHDNAGEAIGGEVGNLIARLDGGLDAPALLLCAHLDTIEPTEALVLRREKGAFASDGTTILGADDRAGVAAILEVVHALTEQGVPYPPLELVFTVAEEVGVMGSMALDTTGLTAAMGFVPDSSGAVGTIITRAPAQQKLEVTIHGKAAHAGMAPEQGISAITVAARAIAGMRQGRIDEETTANIGVIHGGKATNIIADTVQIEGEARSRDPRKLEEQVAHMVACFEAAAEETGAQAEITVLDVYPAFNLADDAPAVLAARVAATSLGIQPLTAATGGGSDANFLNARGIPTVILSSGYAQPHCTDERQDEEELVRLAEWLYLIVRQAAHT
ncbi:MAG: Carboxypeptidase G2 precursor [bacterium ADurb.Bin429]|nr:MAG: Carboxypeptidase G2 precursor [bacterium ADurb.Bin429]